MFRNIGEKKRYQETKSFGIQTCYQIEWDYQPLIITDYMVDEKGEIILDEKGNPIPIGQHEDENYASWMQENFHFKPDINEIKNIILSNINNETDKKILNGFSWTNSSGLTMNVYLSTENQFNYKAAYDLAYQTEGESLPFILKFGETDSPQYYEFKELSEFSDFYSSCISFINNTLQEGWVKKDSIDWTKYTFE